MAIWQGILGICMNERTYIYERMYICILYKDSTDMETTMKRASGGSVCSAAAAEPDSSMKTSPLAYVSEIRDY
jgi:hypothetical protein